MKNKLKLLITLMLFGIGVQAQVGVSAADTSLRATVAGVVQVWKSKSYYSSLFSTFYNKTQADARFAPAVGGGYIQNQSAFAQAANGWINGFFRSLEGQFGPTGSTYTRVDQYGIFSPGGGSAYIGWNGSSNIFYGAGLHNFYNNDQSTLYLHLGDGSGSPISYAPRLRVTTAPSLSDDVVRLSDLTTLVPVPTLQSVTSAGDSTTNRIVGSDLIKSPRLKVGDYVYPSFSKYGFWYGDSETVGVSTTSNYYRWTTIVSRQLGVVERNRGISGTRLTTITPGDSSFVQRVVNAPIYNSAIHSYLSVAYGVNDAISGTDSIAFRNGLETGLQTLFTKGWPASKIILISPAPQSGNSTLPLQRTYTNIYRDKSSQYGTLFVDVNGAYLSYPTNYRNFIASDGTHINNEGNQFVARLILSKLKVVGANQISNLGYTYNYKQTNLIQRDSVLLVASDSLQRHIASIENSPLKPYRFNLGTSKLNYWDQNTLKLGQDASNTTNTQIDLGTVANAQNTPSLSKLILFRNSGTTTPYANLYGINVEFNDGMVFYSGDINKYKFNGNIFATANLTLGTSITGATTTPAKIDLGNNYSSVQGANLKINVGNGFGFGNSLGVNAQLDIVAPTGGDHKFWAGTTVLGRWIGASNSLVVGSTTSFSTNAVLQASGKAAVKDSLDIAAVITDGTVPQNKIFTFRGTGAQRSAKSGLGTGPNAGLTLFSQNLVAGTGGMLFKVGSDAVNTTLANADMSISQADNIVRVNTRLGVKNKVDGLTTDSLVTSNPSTGILQKIPNVYVSGTTLADTTASLYRTKANSLTLAQLQTKFNTKQNTLSGTGFVKVSGTTVSYDNSTYLTSYTETDPTVPSNVKAITGTNIANWNTAFGWGNHASAGYAHLAGTEFFSGYKRFQADAGIDRALYMGSAANDNPSIGDIIQMSNTNDASTTTAGYALQLGTGSDFLFNSFNGAPGSISFIPRFRMTNAGLLNYATDMGASYGDRTVTDLGNVKKYVHSETGYTVSLTGSGNGSSTTITIAHGLTGIDTDSFVLLTPNSNAASNYKYATVDATNVYIYYAVAPTTGSQNLSYSALIKYVQR